MGFKSSRNDSVLGGGAGKYLSLGRGWRVYFSRLEHVHRQSRPRERSNSRSNSLRVELERNCSFYNLHCLLRIFNCSLYIFKYMLLTQF